MTKPRWIGEYAPNLGHDPNNPFPLKKTEEQEQATEELIDKCCMLIAKNNAIAIVFLIMVLQIGVAILAIMGKL